MLCTRHIWVLLAALIATPLAQAMGQDAVAVNRHCGYCGVFQGFITEAIARRDHYALEKLRHDLPRMTALSEADRKHLEQSLDSAILKVQSPRSPFNSAVRRAVASAATEAAHKSESPLSKPAEAASVSALVIPAPHEAGSVAVEQMVDGSDEPGDQDHFEYCKRVIEFASARRDLIALDNIARRLPQANVTEARRAQLGRMIRLARSTDGPTPGPDPVEEELASSSVEVPPSASVASGEVAAENGGDVVRGTGDSNVALSLPAEAEDVFSKTYLRLRQRYLDFFLFQGMTATELDVKLSDGKVVLSRGTVTKASFADQTLHMGQAMLAFAGESQILRAKGLSSAPSERTLKLLLDAFETLEEADAKLYGASKAGFFVRDAVSEEDRKGVPAEWELKSDMKDAMAPGGNKSQNAMSLDQATSLFVGWWAITKWSGDADNVARAKKQIDAVISFLNESRFVIRLPNGEGIPPDRGPDFRYAAGFLCHIATQATGKPYFLDAKIDITAKGDPIRFRDDNLGEFEIPAYRIPASMPVALSHPAVLALKPVGLIGLTAPPKIAIRISDLFADVDDDREINLPCAHLEPAHPGGHTNNTPCPHLTAAHPGGDPGPTVPCTHTEKVHPNGDTGPCLHMTAKHPAGDDGPVLPCHHLRKEHDHDWIESTVTYPCPTISNPGRKCTKTISTKVPCTHIGPEHPGGHPTKIPCVHLVPKHPGGHTVPCIHLKLAHPGGHPTKVPCVHLVPAHPGGHNVTLPCLHIEPKHPAGHTFDLTKLDVEVPLGEKLHSYARHIVLQCLAFEPAVNGPLEFVPAAINSKHSWSGLLRHHARGDTPSLLVAPQAQSDLGSMSDVNGLSNLTPIPWAKTNRWERCTDLEPDAGGPYAHNGLDFLSLEVLKRLAQ